MSAAVPSATAQPLAQPLQGAGRACEGRSADSGAGGSAFFASRSAGAAPAAAPGRPAARRAGGRLAPRTALLLGAALVVAADAVARTIVQPAELPLGVLTAFIGVPLFLAMLRQFRGKV